MDSESNPVVIDALAQNVDINEILPKQFKRLELDCALKDLTVEEYKSIFFLLTDYLDEDEFPNLIKKDKTCLRQRLDKILKENNESILIELLGTMKMYKKLKTLGTCRHFYEKRPKKFDKIDGVWKMFYALCEEMTDIDLEIFKQCLPENVNKQIKTAEEWFYWALKEKLFSKTNFTSLEKLFHNYPNCLAIIKEFEKPASYDIRIPTANIHCGIAVILNYETFSGEFKKRDGSDIDVKQLEDVWNKFGFKTEVHTDLTCEDSLTTLENYACLDHSDYDAFVCCILSHGLLNCVISSDGKEMPIPVLVGKITECRSLNSKPKLFFIQACQGTGIQQGPGEPVFYLPSPDKSESVIANFHRPATPDVLIAVSSIDGYVSFRHKNDGTFFIQELCKVMLQKGDKLSILEVMIEVNNHVRNKPVDLGPGRPRKAQQIPNVQYTLEKTLILKRRTE